ncbi:MAG: hypothetical protein EPN37_03455 [Chitinophagaceae bacterium]|nr:MAG: hypothetical protein EPN37_03455 [Chitinophagaceae bacterium]
MKRRFTFGSAELIMLMLMLPGLAKAQSGIQKISAHIFTRQAENGYKASLEGDIYYSANGNMVSYFTSPKNYVVITNGKGEMRIYNPQKNTVIQLQNNLLSSNITPFYYFFSGKTGDMGLRQSGYHIIDTKFDGDLKITLWRATHGDVRDPVTYVKLVHDKNNPVYMDYENAGKNIIRKVYYYNYTNLNGVEFPETFTEILYQNKDSVITKTEYSGFKINEQANNSLFEFRIPANAKLVTQ